MLPVDEIAAYLGKIPVHQVHKLDEFLKASGRKLLDHAGTISAEVAKAKAEREYERYHAREDAKPRMIDAAFEATAKQLKTPGSTRTKKGRRKP